MDKSLINLKNASDFIDKEKKKLSEAEPLDSPEPIAEGEAIPEIKQQRQRQDKLESQMAELQAKEKELNLRFKIIKKKEQLEKIQLRFDQITEEESYYTERPDSDGYTQLREDKWENDFQELIVKLKNIELDEFNGTVDLQDSQEAKANVTNQIKKLISIKKKTNTRNTMNKLKRGFQKTMKGIGSFSKEMSKFSGEMSKFGNQVGGSDKNYNSTNWENFFNDKPTRTKTTKTTKKRKSRKRSKTTKKSKKRKSRKRSKTTKTQEESRESSGAFGGFGF
jgi:hypothetical protein